MAKQGIKDSLHYEIFIDILYAVVIGETIFEYGRELFDPLAISTLAMITVYIAIISSWLFWHKAITRYPHKNPIKILSRHNSALHLSSDDDRAFKLRSDIYWLYCSLSAVSHLGFVYKNGIWSKSRKAKEFIDKSIACVFHCCYPSTSPSFHRDFIHNFKLYLLISANRDDCGISGKRYCKSLS